MTDTPTSPAAPTVDIAQIAKVCHEANRAYSQTLGDSSLKSWEESDQAHRDSIIQGVIYRINNPDAGPGAAHDAWLDAKTKDGWKYGAVLDRGAKVHPAMVPFENLPITVQIKDSLFSGIVKSLGSDVLAISPRDVYCPPTMIVKAGEKNDPSVQIGNCGSQCVTQSYRAVMSFLGFTEAEGSFVYNANGRAIWVNPTLPLPTEDITNQIVAAAEAIGARAKINQIRAALDIPFEVVATAK
jgi:hypothetical protein